MSSDLYTLEPFPAFVDAVDPSGVNFSSMMSTLQLLAPSGAVQLRRKQDSISSHIYNSASLRYYQFEVTCGLYMLTPVEKLICYTIILGILTAFSYAMYYGLQSFLVRSICHLIYYISGSFSGVEDICPATTTVTDMAVTRTYRIDQVERELTGLQIAERMLHQGRYMANDPEADFRDVEAVKGWHTELWPKQELIVGMASKCGIIASAHALKEGHAIFGTMGPWYTISTNWVDGIRAYAEYDNL